MFKKSFFCFFIWIFLFSLEACQEGSSRFDGAQEKSQKRFREFHACLDSIEQYQERVLAHQSRVYLSIDPKEGQVRPGQESVFKRGLPGKGAVLLMHGILSFPASLQRLVDELNGAGLTVLAPLITGFGSSVKVANAGGLQNWQSSLDQNYRALSLCFEEISLVGFSLGGALATDFVLNRYSDYVEESSGASLSSLVLLSPAIKPAEKFVTLKAGATLIFTDEIPFWLISKIKNDPDIDEMMKNPEQYNQSFPVKVGLNLKKLSDVLEDSDVKRFSLHELPVSLDYSQSDTATDWDKTRDFLTDHFFDVRVFNFSKEDRVPHTLELNKETLVGEKIRKGLLRFIERHSKELAY